MSKRVPPLAEYVEPSRALPLIPVASLPERASLLSGQEPRTERAGPSQPCVLVIEPSLTLRLIIALCLQSAGLQVVDFPDGVQVLRGLNNAPACKPDLILLDQDIPQMDWYTLLRNLQKHPACLQTAFVLLLSHESPLDRLKVRLAGAHGSLTKPFRTQELLRVVQQALHAPPARNDAKAKMISP
ncbi:MAG TPA: response regulator [Ktedonobacteraceae bacterium]|nr:response regulator [Ktedonobacteraceae bacterium]